MSFLLLSACLTGCSGRSTETGGQSEPLASGSTFDRSYPIRAIATVGMVADVVRRVGGERVEVTQMMGSGVDPHLYKTTRDDVQTLLRGDIVFYCGLMLEGKMSDTLVKISQSKPTVAVAAQIDRSGHLPADGEDGHADPHVWMDVSAWSQTVEVVARALGEFDPRHADEYRSNAAAYQAELLGLHEYGRAVLATIPPRSRVLITSHDAFNYFGRAYGLDVQGVQGLSTDSEAGLQRINELVDLIVRNDVKAVFVESSVSPKNIEALVDGARSRGHDLVIGGELYSDAMGEAGSYEGTYVGMLDHNITVVARALGGEAPGQGLQAWQTVRDPSP